VTSRPGYVPSTYYTSRFHWQMTSNKYYRSSYLRYYSAIMIASAAHWHEDSGLLGPITVTVTVTDRASDCSADRHAGSESVEQLSFW
jgi:hypothetical protein